MAKRDRLRATCATGREQIAFSAAAAHLSISLSFDAFEHRSDADRYF
jgi:hypothetical protein